MSSQRFAGLVVVFSVLAIGHLWRSAGARTDPTARALAESLQTLAADTRTPIAFVSERPELDTLMLKTLRGSPGSALLAHDPAAIQAAFDKGIVLAAEWGSEYLQLLGYELDRLSWTGDARAPALRRVHRRLRCAPIRASAWSALPGLEYTGRLGIVLPRSSEGSMVLVIGDTLPLDVDVTSGDGAPVTVRRTAITSIASAPPDYWIEGRSPLDAPGAIQELTLVASAERDRLLGVGLGRRAPRVLARMRNYPDSERGTICAAPIGVDQVLTDPDMPFTLFPDVARHFGTGWGDVLLERDVGPVRWMGRDGALLVRLGRRGSVRVTLRAYRPAGRGDGEVALRINDTFDVEAVPLRGGIQSYEWTVPEAAWVLGTNEILVHVTGEGDQNLLAFARLELVLKR